MSNVHIQGVPLALGLVWWGRKYLDTPANLPKWDKWLAQAWKPGVGVLVLTSVFELDGLGHLFLAAMLGVWVAVCWQLRTYRPALLAGVALLPYTVVYSCNEFLKLVGLAAEKEGNGMQALLMFSFVWLLVLGQMARIQKKNLDAEQQRRAIAGQAQHTVEIKNQSLEREVQLRTAALSQQTDQLRTTLHELQETQNQLIQREKMASLGELTAGIAHEIQNPLNFVNNFADVSVELITELEEERARPERDRSLEADLLTDLRENLRRIAQHGGRAAGIVKGMLEHSRQTTGERQPTDLNQLADEYLRLAYHGLRAKDKSFNATLETDFAPGLPLVEAVPGDLGRVVLNLFTNAFYAVQKRQQQGEAGYAPTVSVRTRQLDAAHVEVRVADNGTGIPAEVQARIFQPFFTTKPAGEGTGLGLSLSHDIVTQGHGGTLRVESTEGQGTAFSITLPT